jgi:hypothetical protein
MTERDRRALQLGGAVILAAFLLLRLIPQAWAIGRRNWEDFRGRAELLARAQKRVEGARSLEDSSLAAKRRLLALAPALVDGNDDAEALTTLSAELAGIAMKKQLRMLRTSSIADSARAGQLRRLSVQLAVEGDSRGILDFLAAISRTPEVLVPVDLRIVASDPWAAGAAAEVLQTELTLQAWYLERGRGQ